MNERGESTNDAAKAIPTTQHPPKARRVKCFHCTMLGHFKRNCRIRIAEEKKAKSGRAQLRKQANAAVNARSNSVREDNGDAFVVSHALAANITNNWIIDSGATSHMCNDKRLFSDFRRLEKPEQVTLGDRHELEAVGRGTVYLSMKMPKESVNYVTFSSCRGCHITS